MIRRSRPHGSAHGAVPMYWLLAGLCMVPLRASAQGIGVPPPYDHGLPNQVTFQVETAIAFDQPYAGSSAFRLRGDYSRLGLGIALGAAFGKTRSVLFALTPQVRLIEFCGDCEARLVIGGFADGQRIAGDGAQGLRTGSAGLGLEGEFDLSGYSVDVSSSFRAGLHAVDGGSERNSFWGGSVGASIGIPLTFELVTNIDYMSRASRAEDADGAWTIGFGIRARVGPGT